MRGVRFASWAAAGAALVGCIESEVTLDLRKDGTGSYAWSWNATPKGREAFLACLKECREATPAGEEFRIPPGLLEPDDADRKVAAEAGLVLAEWESGYAKDEPRGRGRAEFDRFSSLDSLTCFKTGANLYSLRRGEDGVHELTLRPADAKSKAANAARFAKSLSDPRYGGPFSRLAGKSGGLMTEMRFAMALSVPGEILDFDCLGEVERKGPGSLRLDLSPASVIAKVTRLEAEGKAVPRPGGAVLRVRFRMAAGESIPDGKLTPEPAEPTVPGKR